MKGFGVSSIAGRTKGGVTVGKMKTERPTKDLQEYKRKWILANKILNMLRIAKGLPTVKCPYKEEREAMTEASAVSEEKTEEEREE